MYALMYVMINQFELKENNFKEKSSELVLNKFWGGRMKVSLMIDMIEGSHWYKILLQKALYN